MKGKANSFLHSKDNTGKLAKIVLSEPKKQESNPDTGADMEQVDETAEEDNMEEEKEKEINNKQNPAHQS